MTVSFTIEATLPEVKIESIVFDEWGDAEIRLSANGREAKCWISATGSDRGSMLDALLSLAGIQIAKIDQRPCYAAPHAQERPQRPV